MSFETVSRNEMNIETLSKHVIVNKSCYLDNLPRWKKKNACVKKGHASLSSFINLPSLKRKDYIAVEAVNQDPKDQSCSVNSSIQNLPNILPTIKNNCKKKTKLYKPCLMEICTSTILPRGHIMRLCQYNLMTKNPSNNLP